MIFRPLEPADASRSLPYFDAFAFTPGSFPSDRALALTQEGKRGFAYFNVLCHPCPEWSDGAWMDFVRERLPTIKLPSGQEAEFPWFSCAEGQRRRLIAWHDCSTDDLIAASRVILATCATKYNIFLDMYFPTPAYWMFNVNGARFEAFSPALWPIYRQKLLFFHSLLQAGASIIVNGPWEDLPGHRLYIEHAERNLNQAKQVWNLSGYGNIFSCDPRYLEAYNHLRETYRPFRWASFSSSEPGVVDDAYEELASLDAYHKHVELST